ncbi:MAG: DUF2057 family protein, partial [Aeromonas sp.]
RVSLPDEVTVLSPGNGRIDGRQLVFANGVGQALLQYDGVEESRSGSDSDKHWRSRPAVIRVAAADKTLALAGLPTLAADKATFAKQPAWTLEESTGQALPFEQDELKVNGMQVGVDWNAALASYNRDGGKAALGLGSTQSAVPVAAGSLESQLQQLFLRADPSLKRRFIGWAANQL